jgi:hypothetical protein
LHAEAERAAKISNEDKLHQIVNGRVDPSPPLGKEDREGVGDDCSATGLGKEHHLSVRERAEEDSRQESIFTEEEQILLMEGRDFRLAVLLDDFGLDDQRNPVIACRFSCLQPEHGETTGQAGNTTENGFKGFGQVMRNEVFKDLNCGDPRLPLVRNTRLSTDTHNHLVVVHAVHQMAQRGRENLCVGINLSSSQ